MCGNTTADEPVEESKRRHFVSGWEAVRAYTSYGVAANGRLQPSGWSVEENIDDAPDKLRCLCGDEFDDHEAAKDHLRENADEVLVVKEYPRPPKEVEIIDRIQEGS